jgi:hypothetical protein
VAVSTGHDNSVASNAVEYKVGVEISGTWLINERPTVINIEQNVKFRSGTLDFSKITMTSSLYSSIEYDNVTAFLDQVVKYEWYNGGSFRYVTFDGVQFVKKAFYNYFRSIATKQ